MTVYVAMLQEDDGAYLLGVHATRIGAQRLAEEKDPVQQPVSEWEDRIEWMRRSSPRGRAWVARRLKTGGHLFVIEQRVVGELTRANDGIYTGLAEIYYQKRANDDGDR